MDDIWDNGLFDFCRGNVSTKEIISEQLARNVDANTA